MKFIVKSFDYNKIDAKRLKEFRRVYGLTEAELGSLLGVSTKEVEGYEKGEVIPFPVKRLFDVLHFPSVSDHFMDIEGLESTEDFMFDLLKSLLCGPEQTKKSKFTPHLEQNGKNIGYIGQKTTIEGFNHEILHVGDVVEVTHISTNKKTKSFVCKEDDAYIFGFENSKGYYYKEGLITDKIGFATHTYVVDKNYHELNHGENLVVGATRVKAVFKEEKEK